MNSRSYVHNLQINDLQTNDLEVNNLESCDLLENYDVNNFPAYDLQRDPQLTKLDQTNIETRDLLKLRSLSSQFKADQIETEDLWAHDLETHDREPCDLESDNLEGDNQAYDPQDRDKSSLTICKSKNLFQLEKTIFAYFLYI